MTSRTITNDYEHRQLIKLLQGRKRPFSVEIIDGRKRSVEQNRLQRLWIKEAAEQLGDRTQEELRGWCKLHHGVPILRAENEQFREAYDRVIRPLPYEAKLAAMMVPLDMPVTRIMTVQQKTQYLEAIERHFLEQGIVLTIPHEREAA